MPSTGTTELIHVRAAVNDWLSRNFPVHRKNLVQSKPRQREDSWLIHLHAFVNGKRSSPVGELLLNTKCDILEAPKIEDVSVEVLDFVRVCTHEKLDSVPELIKGDNYER